jgi:hypothetical protein
MKKKDAIIIGETHVDRGNGEKEASLIRIVAPEFVVVEPYYKQEDLDKKSSLYRESTLSKIFDRYGIDPDSEDRETLDSYVWMLKPEKVDEIREKIWQHELDAAEEGDEEKMSRYRRANTHLLWLRRDDLDTHVTLDYVLQAASDVGARVVSGGIAERKVARLETEYTNDFLGALAEYSEKSKRVLEETDPKLEENFARTILRCVRERKTNRPVIGIIGKHHVREDSEIYSILDETGLNYKVIRLKSELSPYDALRYAIGLGLK